MAFTLDDDDRDSAGSSDNEQDELMEDALEGDAEAENEGDIEGDEDDNDENEDNEEDDDNEQDEQDQISDSQRPKLHGTTASSEEATSQVNGLAPNSNSQLGATHASASPRQASLPISQLIAYPKPRPEALTAKLYDIVPTIAAPQSTSINAITATPDMRYWFSGGSDCYVRKYNGVETINGKTQLTVAQRHPFVDSVTKAGVLMSYWENEEPNTKNPTDEPALSPVYSLAVEREALWLLSGLESGAINLQSVRHDEGKRITCLQKHTSAVSVLTLTTDEQSVLSGSWDKNIFDWDLNTGQVRRDFKGSGGQISAIQMRPASSLPVPAETGEPVAVVNGTYSSNNADKPLTNGDIPNGVSTQISVITDPEPGTEDVHVSPVETDSLFGDTNSLFGDNDTTAPSGANFGGDEDDEFAHTIGMAVDEQEHVEAQADTTMADLTTSVTEPAEDGAVPAVQSLASDMQIDDKEEADGDTAGTISNGLPHAEESAKSSSIPAAVPETQDAEATSGSTFLSASFDGTLMIWDRRQQAPVARMSSRTGGPWCMDACWSPEGNSIYAGRRNNTVEEFNLHKGLKTSSRTFRFPAGSGPVSAIRAMPNGRHLICASYDILRLYDLKEQSTSRHAAVPFLIVPGPPRAGVISALHIDPTCKYMISAAGNRGWDGSTTEVLIGYEIGVV